MPNVTGLSDAGEALALNAVAAAAVKLALSTTPIQEDGTGLTAPTSAGYAVKTATFGALTAAEPSTVSNTSIVAFGNLEPSGATESIGYWAALNASNVVLFGGAFTAAVIVQKNVDDPVSFAVGAAVLSVG